MAERLAEGLWWLHGTRGSNVFLVAADDGSLALVDTGFGDSAGAILRDIATVGEGRPLAAILLTHRHADHSGSAAALVEATGAMVIAGLGDCSQDEDGHVVIRPTVGRSHLSRFAMRRVGGGTGTIPVAVAVERVSEVLPGVRAIPVPGHTDGSLCFAVDRLGAAFVGDLVVSHGGRLARSLRAANRDDPRYLRTMAEFATTAPAIGLPGHGVPILAGFGDALRELSALPRRPATPRTTIKRVGRVARFTHGMWRRRKASAR